DIDKVGDPKIAGRVLEELGRLDVEPDGPGVEIGQKLLKGVVGIEDPQLAADAMEAVGRRDLDPKRRAALADAMADAGTPAGQEKLRDAIRRSLGGDSEVLHTVRPIEEVPKTPAIGEHLGDAMKDFPYTSEQTEVSHDIVNKYREMLRAGIPLEPCNVVNGQHLIDGHHRAIAQMLELGELVYVNHSEV